MLFAQSAELIRAHIQALAALGPRAITLWNAGKRPIGQGIEIRIEPIRLKEIAGEPRRTVDASGAVRTWHYTEELTVLLKVYSIAPPLHPGDRGTLNADAAFEIASRIARRLNNNVTKALDPDGLSFVGAGDILPLAFDADGRAVDSATCELVFRLAGSDTQGAESEGEIRSIAVTSHVKRPDETEIGAPLAWADHVITKP